MIHIPLDESAHDIYMQIKIRKANSIILFWCKFTSRSHGQNCFLEMFTARLAIYHYWLFKMEFIQESFFSSVACSESPSKTCFFLSNSASAYLQHGSGFKNFFGSSGDTLYCCFIANYFTYTTHTLKWYFSKLDFQSRISIFHPLPFKEIYTFRPML